MTKNRWLTLILTLTLLLSPLNLAAAQTANHPGFAANMESKSPDFAFAPSATTWYVDHAAAGANNGSSWTDAYTRLQSALTSAQAGDQIWVAQGIYTPTSTITRTATFTLTAGVALYGGFDPASGADAWEERDWQAHITVLSGDLDGNDLTDPNGVVTSTANIVGDNAYHVLSANSVDTSAVLDGFYITAGKADGGNPYDRGGGMYNMSSSPSLVNVIFSANKAFNDGGGMYNTSSNPRLTNVTFSANGAYWGGGMFNEASSPSLVNVTFSTNGAQYFGGGMYSQNSSDPSLVNVAFTANQAGAGGGMANYENSPSLVNVTFSANMADRGGGMTNQNSNPSLVNVTFSTNRATAQGGGMDNWSSGPNLSNSILWGNIAPSGAQIYNYSSSAPTIHYSDVQGGCPTGCTCDHLINADPLFIRLPSGSDYGDLRLQHTSPVIDAGNNTYLPTDAFDLDGDGDTGERLPLDLGYLARFVDIPWIADSGLTDPPNYPFVVDMGAYEAFPWRIFLPIMVK